jgi:hypothetical protein
MGSILGSVLGAEVEGDEVVGAILGELDGLDGEVLGAILGELRAARGAPVHRGGHRRLNARAEREAAQHAHHGRNRPDWRGRELAPGVNEPGEGVVPLTMLGAPGNVYGASFNGSQITWSGQLQKPFQSRRLLFTTARSGPTAIGLVTGQIFVGVDLNQAAIQPVDLEALGAPTAFDTGLSLMQAPPGVIVQIISSIQPSPTGSDSVTASASFLGHIIH